MAYHDDLFYCFICMWVTLCSIIIQFVLDFLPGKSTIGRHICTGTNPDLDIYKDMKIIRSYSLIFGGLLLFLVYTFVSIKISIFKRDTTIPPLSTAIQNLKQKPLADYIVFASIILVTLINTSVSLKIQSIDMKESHIFPNYLYLYYIHLWLFHFYSIVFLITYLIRNKPIRDSFCREVKSLLARR